MASGIRSTVFRVTGFLINQAESDIRSKFNNLLTEDERQRVVAISCIPSCDGSQTSNALVEFKAAIPNSYPISTTILTAIGRLRSELRILTLIVISSASPKSILQLPVWQSLLSMISIKVCDSILIIAIAGLDGHAYGSSQGKSNLGWMLLRNLLSKDLPSGRTMIYGYNSKLSSHGPDTILDFRTTMGPTAAINGSDTFGSASRRSSNSTASSCLFWAADPSAV